MISASFCSRGLLIAESKNNNNNNNNENRVHGAILNLNLNAVRFVELLLLFKILVVSVE